MKNDGYKKELELIEVINGKRIKELGVEYQMLLKKMGLDRWNSTITAYKYEFHAKPDIVIKCNNITRYVSLKTGNSKYVHAEGIKPFVLFLRELGISSFTQRVILMHHYGDGTLDGTGKQRYSSLIVRKALEKEIQIANRELNELEIVNAVLERCLFEGPLLTNVKGADHIVYQNGNEFYCASKEMIIDSITKNRCDEIKTLHIGPLTIRPYARNVTHKQNEYKREIVQINWSLMGKAIMEIDLSSQKGKKKVLINKDFNLQWSK